MQDDEDSLLLLMRRLFPLDCMGAFKSYDCCNPCCWQCKDLSSCILKWARNEHNCLRKPSESRRYCSGARKAYQDLKKGGWCYERKDA